MEVVPNADSKKFDSNIAHDPTASIRFDPLRLLANIKLSSLTPNPHIAQDQLAAETIYRVRLIHQQAVIFEGTSGQGLVYSFESNSCRVCSPKIVVAIVAKSRVGAVIVAPHLVADDTGSRGEYDDRKFPPTFVAAGLGSLGLKLGEGYYGGSGAGTTEWTTLYSLSGRLFRKVARIPHANIDDYSANPADCIAKRLIGEPHLENPCLLERYSFRFLASTTGTEFADIEVRNVRMWVPVGEATVRTAIEVYKYLYQDGGYVKLN